MPGQTVPVERFQARAASNNETRPAPPAPIMQYVINVQRAKVGIRRARIRSRGRVRGCMNFLDASVRVADSWRTDPRQVSRPGVDVAIEALPSVHCRNEDGHLSIPSLFSRIAAGEERESKNLSRRRPPLTRWHTFGTGSARRWRRRNACGPPSRPNPTRDRNDPEFAGESGRPRSLSGLATQRSMTWRSITP